MHEAALKHLGLRGRYELVDIPPEQFDDGVDSLIARGVTGFNVTIPFKEATFDRVDELTEIAENARAVNTVKILENGMLTGHNTDVAGFLEALLGAINIHAGRYETPASLAGAGFASVLGSGGAAPAAILALDDCNLAGITMVARNRERADQLIADLRGVLKSRAALSVISSPDEFKRPDAFHLLVNCTPIGHKEEAVPDWLFNFLKRVRP